MEERIALRLPPDLARRLRDIAEFEKRSINRQVEQFVEEGVRRWEQAHPEAEQAQGNDRPPG